MCGRYTIVSEIKKIEKRFNVKAKDPQEYIPNYNLSHSEKAPVITSENPSELDFFHFGYKPSYWKKGMPIPLNARSEGKSNPDNNPSYTGGKGIISSGYYRSQIRRKRCLVIADCFIEGPQEEKLSKPFCVYLKGGVRPFAFAGIYDEWVDKQSGEIYKGFAIITTVSNAVTSKIQHHRSPVILGQKDEARWLDASTDLSEITRLLKPYDSSLMNAYPISSEIKNPKVNHRDLLKPIGQRIFPEKEYSVKQELKLFGMGESPSRRRRNQEEE